MIFENKKPIYIGYTKNDLEIRLKRHISEAVNRKNNLNIIKYGVRRGLNKKHKWFLNNLNNKIDIRIIKIFEDKKTALKFENYLIEKIKPILNGNSGWKII